MVFSMQINYFKNCFCKYLCEYFSIVFDNIQHFHDLVIAFAGVFKIPVDSATKTESFFKKKKKIQETKTKSNQGYLYRRRDEEHGWLYRELDDQAAPFRAIPSHLVGTRWPPGSVWPSLPHG